LLKHERFSEWAVRRRALGRLGWQQLEPNYLANSAVRLALGLTIAMLSGCGKPQSGPPLTTQNAVYSKAGAGKKPTEPVDWEFASGTLTLDKQLTVDIHCPKTLCRCERRLQRVSRGIQCSLCIPIAKS